eukprot:2485812-Pyramimonas_sp.AAC.1
MAAARAQRAAARSPKGRAAAACEGWSGITLIPSADAAPRPTPVTDADAAAPPGAWEELVPESSLLQRLRALRRS